MNVVRHIAPTQNFYIEGFNGSQIYISGTDAKHVKILDKELKIELLQNKINEIRKTGLIIDIEWPNKNPATYFAA
jgi:hypothetical protein